jgi:hypothetical protein
VVAQPAGSPQRALVEWLSLMQQGRIEPALDYYARSVDIPEDQLRFIWAAAQDYWAQLGPPRIVTVERDGSRATVYAVLTRSTEAPNGRLDVFRRPFAFRLREERGGWRLADDLFLFTTGPKGAGIGQ